MSEIPAQLGFGFLQFINVSLQKLKLTVSFFFFFQAIDEIEKMKQLLIKYANVKYLQSLETFNPSQHTITMSLSNFNNSGHLALSRLARIETLTHQMSEVIQVWTFQINQGKFLVLPNNSFTYCANPIYLTCHCHSTFILYMVIFSYMYTFVCVRPYKHENICVYKAITSFIIFVLDIKLLHTHIYI